MGHTWVIEALLFIHEDPLLPRCDLLRRLLNIIVNEE